MPKEKDRSFFTKYQMGTQVQPKHWGFQILLICPHPLIIPPKKKKCIKFYQYAPYIYIYKLVVTFSN